jgi:hypothetical protein
MKASFLYRASAILLVLFAAGHMIGFSQPPDPTWHVDSIFGSMRSTHFDVMGFNRTYWDFFMGAGLCVGLFYLFSAVLAWQLGGLPAETLTRMRGVTWAFAICFAAITVVSWVYLFTIPIAFSVLTTLSLTLAAWRASKSDI